MSVRLFAHLSALALLACSLAACGGGGSNASAVLPVSSLPDPGAASPPPLIPASTAIVPTHIPVWAFDEYNSMGSVASSSAVQKYVTYAGGGLNNTKALSDCNTSPKSCYAVFYVDPNLIYTTCPGTTQPPFVTAASESWYVHESGYSDFNHRLRNSYPRTCGGVATTTPVYLANDANSAVQSFMRNYLQTYGDAWDYYWMDDTKGRVLTQGYGPSGGMCLDASNHYCWNTQEYATDSTVVSAHGSYATAMVHKNGSGMKFFFNGVGVQTSAISNLNIFASSPNYSGAICENCVVANNVIRTSLFGQVLTSMAQTNAIPNAKFILLGRGSASAGSAAQIAQRLVSTAIAWIGFADGRTIVFPDFEDNTRNLAAWPEDMLYPTAPKESMRSSASDVAVAAGVWRREFGACYQNGAPVGQCAALVNSTGSAVTVSSAWLTQPYGHVVTISGGDILSGGTVKLTTTSFVANRTTIPAGSALLLVR
ncbi:MAG: hypothetical protein KGN02_09045 [bacterium]|nr:hypothetical protein [bacterium]